MISGRRKAQWNTKSYKIVQYNQLNVTEKKLSTQRPTQYKVGANDTFLKQFKKQISNGIFCRAEWVAGLGASLLLSGTQPALSLPLVSPPEGNTITTTLNSNDSQRQFLGAPPLDMTTNMHPRQLMDQETIYKLQRLQFTQYQDRSYRSYLYQLSQQIDPIETKQPEYTRLKIMPTRGDFSVAIPEGWTLVYDMSSRIGSGQLLFIGEPEGGAYVSVVRRQLKEVMQGANVADQAPAGDTDSSATGSNQSDGLNYGTDNVQNTQEQSGAQTFTDKLMSSSGQGDQAQSKDSGQSDPSYSGSQIVGKLLQQVQQQKGTYQVVVYDASSRVGPRDALPYYDVEYDQSVCRGTLFEQRGGNVSCVDQYDQTIPTIQRRHLLSTTTAAGSVWTVDASADAARWPQVSTLITAAVRAFAVYPPAGTSLDRPAPDALTTAMLQQQNLQVQFGKNEEVLDEKQVGRLIQEALLSVDMQEIDTEAV